MKTLRTRKKRLVRSGFTLLELLIVLAIIVSLAAMVAPNLMSNLEDSNIQTTKGNIRHIEGAIERKAVKMNGQYPTGGAEVIEQLAEPYEDAMGQQQKAPLTDVYMDAWQQPFQYAYDSNTDDKPRIWSFGPDKQDNGGDGDDITNYSKDKK